MRSRFILKVLTVLFAGIWMSCGSNRAAITESKQVPDWKLSRPHDPAFFIGVGSCSKKSQPLDYQAIAKKNALSELAGEINVRVQGETFLNTLEVNRNFSEEFISTIRTSSDVILDEFEVAGIYETEDEYWIYCRVNKAQYWSLKEQKKRQVLDVAYDYLQKGNAAELERNISRAFDLYIHGLLAMKGYWGETNEYFGSNGKLFLDNELYGNLTKLFDELDLDVLDSSIVLSGDNDFRQDVRVVVNYKGVPMPGVSVSYSYERESYSRPKIVSSNQNGEAIITVSGAKPSTSNKLDIQLVTDGILAGDLDLDLQSGLIKNFRLDKSSMKIEFRNPSFFVRSTELHFGQTSVSSALSSAMSKALVDRSMRISHIESEADFVIIIESDTRDAGFSSGFSTVFLNASIVVRKGSNDEVVFQETLSQVKGLHTSKDAADIKAYDEGRKKLEGQIVKSILSAIM